MNQIIAERLNSIYHDKIPMMGEGMRRRRKTKRATSKKSGAGTRKGALKGWVTRYEHMGQKTKARAESKKVRGGMGTRKGALEGWVTRYKHMGQKSKARAESKKVRGGFEDDMMTYGGVGTTEGAIKGWKTRRKHMRASSKCKCTKRTKKRAGVIAGVTAGVRAGVPAGYMGGVPAGGARRSRRAQNNPWLQFLHEFRMELKREGRDLPSKEILKMASHEYHKL